MALITAKAPMAGVALYRDRFATARYVVPLLLLWSNSILLTGGDLVEPPIEMGTNNYVEYRPGTDGTQIIIGVPDGGIVEPASITSRVAGCYLREACQWSDGCKNQDPERCPAKTQPDMHTQNLAAKLRMELRQLTGESPHLVINNLSRRKMDANADKAEATFGIPDAEKAWFEFHGYIKRSKEALKRSGLFIDVHSHEHEGSMVELGYLINASDLNAGTYLPQNSSIRSLATRSPANTSFDAFLSGDLSLGNQIHLLGYAVMPSPPMPKPQDRPYEPGGYDLQRHGSMTSGEIDAIQISAPVTHIAGEGLLPFSKILALAIVNFMDQHYGSVETEADEATHDKPGIVFGTDNASTTANISLAIVLLGLLLSLRGA